MLSLLHLLSGIHMTKTLYEGHYLTLLEDGGYEYVVRRTGIGVAIIVATTDIQNLILIEQFRPPLGRSIIELPAGCQEPEEDIQDTAARELEEETGYKPEEVFLIGSGPSSVGLTNEMLYFFLMYNCHKYNSDGGVDGEKIKTHEVPILQVPDWLAIRSNEIEVDPRIYAGMYLRSRYLNSHKLGS